tara:strand:- start:364 stop:567 length:204 start_codon:yes stop_codon:yes gene_type:complete
MAYGSSSSKSMTHKRGKYRPLTEAQKKKLKKHSEHHSKKHMEMMKRDMRYGMGFDCAHKKAMKKVGK